MLHELLHAYLVWETESNEDSEYNELLDRMYTKYKLPNPAHHNAFVEANFIDIIAQGLKDYAFALGYNLSSMPTSFFEDLAWTGLQKTKVFGTLKPEDIKRMQNVWSLEYKGEINAYSSQIECD